MLRLAAQIDYYTVPTHSC